MENSQANNSRDRVMDALKLFAIFMVIYGHSIQYLVSSNYYDEPVYRIIYSFHMPLFMIIVGYFSTSLLKLSFKEMVYKKFFQLLLPALSFGVVNSILLHLFDNNSFANTYIYCFWFLKSAFICCVLFYLFCKLPPPLFIISLIFSQLTTRFNLPIMYPSFLFGVFLFFNLPKMIKHSNYILPIAFSIYLLMLLFWDQSFWLLDNEGAVVVAYKRLYRILIGLFGSVFFICLFYTISKNCKIPSNIKKYCKWGEYTLGVYILQSFIIEIFFAKLINCDNMNIILFNFLFCPILSCVSLIICVNLCFISDNSKILSLLLLGKNRFHRK